jgi:prepilin-type N-terminal cleavage/methylation domain-containing protein
MRRNGFTMVELIMVIVVIGLLSAIAVPKFTGVKDQAIKATDLSTASAIQTALSNIKSAWGMSENDFDWDNDGVDDGIATELSAQGYPYDLSRNSDDLGALLKSSTKSSFKKMVDKTDTSDCNIKYIIYTSKSTDPVRGIKYPTNISKDIEGKPDKNDFWLYVPELNGTCYISDTGGAVKKRQLLPGDFVLIDVNGTLNLDFDNNLQFTTS